MGASGWSARSSWSTHTRLTGNGAILGFGPLTGLLARRGGPGVETGDIDPLDRGETVQEVDPVLAGGAAVADGVEHGVEGGLGVADEDGVEEVGHRFGVGGARAAADDQRFILGAFDGAAGDAGEIEEIRNVDVVELGLERDADDVEIGDGVVGLEGVEGKIGSAERRRHVGHGGEGPLGQGVVAAVDEVVEDPGALVGHADLVGVGEGEGDPQRDAVPRLAGQVAFETEIARRALDGGQDRVQALAQGCRVDGRHGLSSSVAGQYIPSLNICRPSGLPGSVPGSASDSVSVPDPDPGPE